jgi:hypothetical protein
MLGMGKVLNNNPSCTLSNLYVELQTICLKKVSVARSMKKEETNDPRFILVTKKNIHWLPLID